MRVTNIARLVVAALMLTTATVSMAQSNIADAAMRGDMDAVRALLDQSADVNATQGDGATAMHWAAYRGDMDLARLLIEAGADPSAANRNGSTPLWLASTNGDAAMIGGASRRRRRPQRTASARAEPAHAGGAHR